MQLQFSATYMYKGHHPLGNMLSGWWAFTIANWYPFLSFCSTERAEPNPKNVHRPLYLLLGRSHDIHRDRSY